MRDDKSNLPRTEEHGILDPRVRLLGADQSEAAAGRYQILGEIARSGVGVVHKGRDNDVGRDVALKVLQAEHLRSPELVQRFVEEAQIGGQLQHPGIVPIYELGLQADKSPFFAMKFVKGDTLAARLAARKDPTDGRRELLAVFRDVCRTLAYAHTRGVIHRGLKPGNIMIGNFGEVQVVNWRHAKVMRRGGVYDEKLQEKAERDATMVSTERSGDDSPAALAGSMMGTPAYMPPEQALGRVADLDATSDIFSLGAILCEILTGNPPYEGSAAARLDAAAHARLGLTHSRLDACGADARLVSLCTRCLAPVPRDRPASAVTLADEVATHLTNAESRAHRAQVRSLKAAGQAEAQRRRRRQTTLIGSSVVAAIVLAVGAYVLIDTARSRRARERQAAIETALQDASQMRAAGQWRAALAAAERAIQLGDEGALAADIRSEAEDATAAARREDQDRAFLTELEEIRGRTGEGEDPRAIDAAYVAAFVHRFGSVAAGQERLQASRHAPAFAANLGLWGWLRRTQRGLSDLDARQPERMVRALDPSNADVRDALSTGDVSSALSLIRERGDRLSPALAALAGHVLMAADRPQEAVDFLKRHHQRTPGDFWIHMRLAQAARQIGDRDLALQHFSAALAVEPAHAGAWRQLGIVLHEEDDPDGAIAAFARSLALGSSRQQATEVRACLALAKRLARLGRFAHAAEMYARALTDEATLPSDLADGLRTRAAGAAARAGAAWHVRALAWLREDLEVQRELLSTAPSAVVHELARWKTDADLAAIRDPEDLSEDFQQLWTEVEALLERARRTPR